MDDNNTIKIERGKVVDAVRELPVPHRDTILALYDLAVDKRLSLDEVAEGIGMDATTVHKVFSGTHNAGKDKFCARAKRFLEISREREGTEPLAFVETALSRKIWNAVERARRYNRITFVFGESQIGKTTALEAYASANKENTVLVRMPSSPTLRSFVHRLSRQLGAPRAMSHFDRREFILEKLRRNDVLIVDEAHQAIMTETRINVTHAKIFEFVREIHDTTQCGVTLVATEVFRRELLRDKEFAGVMSQTMRRELYAYTAPKVPTESDLARFAAAYGLPAAEGEAKDAQKDVIEKDRLGVWLTVLRMAAGIATKKGVPMTWDHVLLAKSERERLKQ